jgi:hypothetical protein
MLPVKSKSAREKNPRNPSTKDEILIIRAGPFAVSATGRFAIVALLTILLMVMIGRSVGWL